MPPSKISPTLRVLMEIRDRVSRLEQRQDRSEERIAGELGAVTAAILQVRDLLRERLDDHLRVEDHERRITALEGRCRSAECPTFEPF